MNATSIQVAAVRPEPADSRRLEFLRNDRGVPAEDHYFIVKLFLARPLPRVAEATRLFVGDEEVAKYHGFAGGIFFKVYDPGFFDRHEGQPISFSLDDVRVDTGVKMPGRPAPPTAAAATEDSSTAAAGPRLPTKAEVLRQ
jgi:hypothetical protein